MNNSQCFPEASKQQSNAAVARGRITKNISSSHEHQSCSLPPTKRLHTIECKKAAAIVLRNICEGKTTDFVLHTREEMKQTRRMRSEHYKNYHILCHKNTQKHAGWLVCSSAISRNCPYLSAVKKFDPELGTSVLKNHMKVHQAKRPSEDNKQLTKISQTVKRNVINSAAYAVAAGILPLSFCYEKRGMMQFAKVLVDAGRSLPFNVEVDIKSIMPSDTAVRAAVKRLANQEREKFRTSELSQVMARGGGVTCDGMKNETTGKKFYDLTVHYIELGEPHILTRKRPHRLVSKPLLCIEHKRSETADALRNALDETLMVRYGVELSVFMKSMTFVTDLAATMPCIVGASSSSRRVPFTEKWMGCISHQLNTAMKKVVTMHEGRKSVIATEIGFVKTIVRIFKQGSWNSMLKTGFALMQEVETRFGTTFAVLQRFLKSAKDVRYIVNSKDSEPAKQALDALLTTTKGNGDIQYPALEAIAAAFAPVCHIQTTFESSNNPTMHKILPSLTQCKNQLRLLADGVVRAPRFEPPHLLMQQFCRDLVVLLEKIEVHDLWTAGSLLHPYLRPLGFIKDILERNSMIERGSVLIRRLMSDMCPNSANNIVEPERNKSVVPNELGSTSFCLDDMFDVQEYERVETDTLKKYLSHKFSKQMLSLLREDTDGHGLLEFWLTIENSFPDLSAVALQVLSTPVSSAESERNFSTVNRILSADRSKLQADIIEDLLYVNTVVKQ